MKHFNLFEVMKSDLRQHLILRYIFLKKYVVVHLLSPTLCNPMDYRSSSIQSIVMSDSLRPHGQPRCPSPTPRAYSNSCPLSQWYHPTITSSVVTFSHLQYFPPSGSFQMSQFFATGAQSIGASTSASILPMNIQDKFPLGWTGCISLPSKGLSRVFSNTTVQKHQFSTTQLSL